MKWYSQTSYCPSFVPDANLLIRRLLMAGMLLAILAAVNLRPGANRWNASPDNSPADAFSSTPKICNAKIQRPATASDSFLPDQDPEELSSAHEEFAAITDREPLSNIEMPAYWRLIRWSRETSREAFAQHTRRDLVFTDFVETASKLRGHPVRLKLHLMRMLAHTPEASHAEGVTQLYEGWGVTDESRTNPYCVLFSEKPAQMPVGSRIHEDVTFDGYFFKLLSYDARDDKHRVAPMLIGKLTWHPSPNAADSAIPEWLWSGIVGGILLLSAGVMFMQRSAKPGEKHPRVADAEAKAVSRWLDGLEAPLQTPAKDLATPEPSAAMQRATNTND